MKTKLFLIAMALSNAALAYKSTEGPTGVIRYDRETAMAGYTLIAPAGVENVYLIDNTGWIVKEWKLPGGGHTELLENGDILRLGAATSPDNFVNWGGTAGQINQYFPNGTLRWSYTNVDVDSVLHHTFHQKGDGNSLVAVWERHSDTEALAKGRIQDAYLYPLFNAAGNPSRCARNTYCGGLWADSVIELDGQGRETGWKWDGWTLMENSVSADRLDINYHIPERAISNRSTADYMHVNGIDYDPTHELLLLTSRSFGEIYLIDFHTQQIVGRWGNPFATKTGPEPKWMNDGATQLWGPHGANFVASSASAVRVLVFDNGWMRPEDRRSRVLEIEFKKNAQGRWMPEPNVAWQYQTSAQQSLLTDFQGYGQRLPNGNTLIASSAMQHVIEVTPAGKVAWEFISPVFANGEIKCKFNAEENPPLTFFRAYKYARNYPGLRGLDLRRRRPFSLSCPLGPWLRK